MRGVRASVAKSLPWSGDSMSRIGKKPVPVPSGVTVELQGNAMTVKGSKGELHRTLHSEMAVSVEDGSVLVKRPSDGGRHRALHGLTRSLINNMIVGYSHPVDYVAPQGISITIDGGTKMKVEGIDKELVGQVAAELRAVRRPEPYKGKGIRYVGEQVRRKAGKTGAKV